MKPVARILYGSQNYGLATPDSDKDYKILVTPTFTDLYECSKADEHDLPGQFDDKHNFALDVRKFDSLLMRGDPNAIELLFSIETHYTNWNIIHYLQHYRYLYEDGYLYLVFPQFATALKALTFNTIYHGGFNEKTAPHLIYFTHMLFNFAIHEHFFITFDTWRDCPPTAKEIRLQGLQPIHTFDSLKTMFESARTMAIDHYYSYSLSSDRFASLQNRAYTLHKEMINFVKEEAY